MSRFVVLLAGLLTGAALAGIGASGCCAGAFTHHAVPSGSFVGLAEDGGATNRDIEPDYQLVISGDQSRVSESFTRNGKRYELAYTVTGSY